MISNAAYHRARPDLIIMAITSQPRPAASLGEVVLHDWQAAALLKSSVMKSVITTLEQRLVRKSLGTLSESDQQQLKEAIRQIIA